MRRERGIFAAKRTHRFTSVAGSNRYAPRRGRTINKLLLRGRHLPRQIGRVPRGYLGGHESIVGFIGIGAAIRFSQERRIRTPLDIDDVPNHKRVFGDDLQATGTSLSRRLYYLREHLAERHLAPNDLAVGAKELHIV